MNPAAPQSSPARRILVVPYYYPPFTGSGNRWPALARYLRSAGHEVTVVATDFYGHLDDEGEFGVVRVRDLRSTATLRRLLGRGDRGVGGRPGFEKPPPALLTKLLVPDSYVMSWLPAALVRVRRILARSEVDVLVTSSPPESVHLLGLVLGRRRPAWIADFRDGWGFEPLRASFPTRPQRLLDQWLERRVARTAEVTVGATRPIVEDLVDRLEAPAAHVPNAWDPDLASVGSAPPAGSTTGVRLIYTGTFSGVRGSNPEPLLQALRLVREEVGAAAVQLVLAGRLTAAERALIEKNGVADAVRYLGELSRHDALALQRSADALLLLTSRNRSEATGKIFEYLGAQRPILALAEDNEAARIVRETNSGITVAPDDVEAIAAALRLLAEGELARRYAPRGVENFTYPAPADTMAELVEEAIARRSAARRR